MTPSEPSFPSAIAPGDAGRDSVPADDLLAHVEWVRALARRIVGEEHDADDVEQDAWLVALRRPPARAGNLRGWFARALGNRARMETRGRQRRMRHEEGAAASAPTTAVPAIDLVARAEQHRRLTDLVLELPEPARSTVLLRYFEGRGPSEIAALQRVPVETVRTRLRRAIGTLRARIDERADGRAALGVLAVPAALEIPTLPAAAAAIGAAVTMSTKSKLLFATAAGLVAVALWQQPWKRTTDGPSVAPVAATPPSPVDVTIDDERSGSAEGAVVDRPGPAREAVASSVVAVLPRRLFGRLDGVLPARPWRADLAIDIEARTTDGASEIDETVEVSSDGSFSFALPTWLADATTFEIGIRGRDDGYLPLAFDVSGELRETAADDPLLVPVRAACRVLGRVTLESGEPVEVGSISAFPLQSGVPHGVPVGESRVDRQGFYELLVPFDGAVLIVAVATGRLRISGRALLNSETERGAWLPDGEPRIDVLPGGARIVSTIGRDVDAGPIVLPSAGRIDGRVVWSHGPPVRGVHVIVSSPEPDRQLRTPGRPTAWSEGDRLAIESRQVETDDGGAFVAWGPVGMPLDVKLDYYPDAAAIPAIARTVVPPAVCEFRLGGAVLDLRVVAVGQAVDADVYVERPLVDGSVEKAAWPSNEGRLKIVLPIGEDLAIAIATLGREPHRFTYRADAPGVVERVIDVGARNRGRVTLLPTTSPRPTSVRFLLRPVDDPESEPILREVPSDANGGFPIYGMPAGRYRVQVARPHRTSFGDGFQLPVEFELQIPADVKVDRDWDCALGGRLRLRVVDAAGLSVAGSCALIGPDGASFAPVLRIGRGARTEFTAPGALLPRGDHETDRNLEPGTWTVRTTSSNGDVYEHTVEIVVGEVTELEVRV